MTEREYIDSTAFARIRSARDLLLNQTMLDEKEKATLVKAFVLLDGLTEKMLKRLVLVPDPD